MVFEGVGCPWESLQHDSLDLCVALLAIVPVGHFLFVLLDHHLVAFFWLGRCSGWDGWVWMVAIFMLCTG